MIRRPAVLSPRARFVRALYGICGQGIRLLWLPEGNESASGVDASEHKRVITYSPSLSRRKQSRGKSTSVSFATNLLANGGFETNTTGWTTWQCTIARDTTQSRSGAASCKATHSGGGDYSALNNATTLSGATTGLVYTGSLWVYAEGDAVGKTMQCLLRETGGAAGSQDSNTAITLASGWQQITHTRTIVQNDRTGIELHAYRPSGAVGAEYFFVDDAQIQSGVVAIAANELANSGFEVDTTGWAGTRATPARITTDSKSGVACMTITGDGTTFNYARATRTAPPVGTYTVSAWVKSPTGTLSNVRIDLNNGTNSAGIDKSLAEAEGWVQLTVTITTTVADDLNVDVYVNYSAGASSAVLRVDDVYLQRSGASEHVPTDGASASAYATVPDADNLSFGNGTTDQPFSVVAVANVTDTGVARAIVGKWSGVGAGVNEWLFRIETSDLLGLYLNDESALVFSYRTSSGAITQGSWNVFGASYDATGGATAANGIALYANGAAIASAATNDAAYVAMENTAAVASLGARADGAALAFQGGMAMALVCQRNLSASEHAQIYNLCRNYFGV